MYFWKEGRKRGMRSAWEKDAWKKGVRCKYVGKWGRWSEGRHTRPWLSGQECGRHCRTREPRPWVGFCGQQFLNHHWNYQVAIWQSEAARALPSPIHPEVCVHNPPRKSYIIWSQITDVPGIQGLFEHVSPDRKQALQVLGRELLGCGGDIQQAGLHCRLHREPCSGTFSSLSENSEDRNVWEGDTALPRWAIRKGMMWEKLQKNFLNQCCLGLPKGP